MHPARLLFCGQVFPLGARRDSRSADSIRRAPAVLNTQPSSLVSLISLVESLDWPRAFRRPGLLFSFFFGFPFCMPFFQPFFTFLAPLWLRVGPFELLGWVLGSLLDPFWHHVLPFLYHLFQHPFDIVFVSRFVLILGPAQASES